MMEYNVMQFFAPSEKSANRFDKTIKEEPVLRQKLADNPHLQEGWTKMRQRERQM